MCGLKEKMNVKFLAHCLALSELLEGVSLKNLNTEAQETRNPK